MDLDQWEYPLELVAENGKSFTISTDNPNLGISRSEVKLKFSLPAGRYR